jgi:hypothetical protein
MHRRQSNEAATVTAFSLNWIQKNGQQKARAEVSSGDVINEKLLGRETAEPVGSRRERGNYSCRYPDLEPDDRAHWLRTQVTITLKAFANASPGLRFGNPGEHPFISTGHNSERVASPFRGLQSSRNSFRVAKNLFRAFLTQGCQSATLRWN